MSALHEMFIKIKSSTDPSTETSFNRIANGFDNVNKKVLNFKSSQEKLKNLQLDIKGYEKIQNQIQKTKERSDTLTSQITQFKESLSTVSQGSQEYKEIEKAIKNLEKEQIKVSVQTRKLEMDSENLSNKLKTGGVSTKNLTSEKVKLANKSENLKKEIDKLTSSQKKNESQSKSNESTFGKLAGSMKGLAIGVAGAFGIQQIKQYGDEAIAMANEKIKAETDLQAMLTNTKYLQGDTSAIQKSTKELIDYANAIETVGVIGDETVIAGQAQLATFQLMPSSIKKLSDGMVDMLAKNKGMKATQEDATSMGNLLGKVMSGQIGALSKYGVTFSEAQKKVLKFGKEQERAAMLAQILQENFGGANKALGQTDEGKMVIMRSEIEGIKEEFGKGLLPVQRQFFEIFKGQGPNISKILTSGLGVATKFFDLFVSMHPEVAFQLLADGADIAVSGLGFIIEKGTTFINFLSSSSQQANDFKGAMISLGVGIGAYTLATQGATLWAGIATKATKGWEIAQKGLNFVQNMSPMGLMVAVLAGLTAGMIYAYNHSEAFRQKVHQLTEKIQPFINGVKTAAGWVGKLFGGGDKNINVNSKQTTGGTPYTAYTGYNPMGLKEHANGGVSSKPAIFGEAGPEIAIPLNNSNNAKSLLAYANGIINGDKKSSLKGFSSENSKSDQPFQINIYVTVQGIADTIDKAKKIGNAVGSSALEKLEEELKRLKKDKGRRSLG